MDQKEDYPEWFLWCWDKGHYLVMIAGALALLLIGFASVYLDDRLQPAEKSPQFVPPASYQPPDLTKYAADPAELATLPDIRSLYVPAYSHVYYRSGVPYRLETTLSIRNVDRQHSVYLTSVAYYNTQGELVTHFVDRPIRLAALATLEFLVETRDSVGGSGANFLIDWKADRDSLPPLAETVMVGIEGSEGICFSRSGIEVRPPAAVTTP